MNCSRTKFFPFNIVWWKTKKALTIFLSQIFPLFYILSLFLYPPSLSLFLELQKNEIKLTLFNANLFISKMTWWKKVSSLLSLHPFLNFLFTLFVKLLQELEDDREGKKCCGLLKWLFAFFSEPQIKSKLMGGYREWIKRILFWASIEKYYENLFV